MKCSHSFVNLKPKFGDRVHAARIRGIERTDPARKRRDKAKFVLLNRNCCPGVESIIEDRLAKKNSSKDTR